MGGAGISVQTAAVSRVACVPVARIYSRHQNQWSHRRALLLPTGRCGARQPLFYASRASRRLCFKGGRYGSRSPSYAVAQRGAQRAVQDIVPYLRMLVVGDIVIRARSYATGQQSLDDETTLMYRRVWYYKIDSQVCSKTPALDTTKVYWARRRGEHNRLERTAQTRAEGGGGGGGEEAGELGPVRSAAKRKFW